MQATTRGLTAEPLARDTAHFGRPVGRIDVGRDDSDLAEALTRAERDGLELVYVFAPFEFEMSTDLLTRFDGLKVDDRAVFSIDIDGRAAGMTRGESVIVAEHPRSAPSRALIDLALAAGEYSRFAVDPRIPIADFHRLYEIWIARSCRHEAADVVFIAQDSVAAGEPLGFITAGVQDDAGVIGLVAVDSKARRRGVGRALMGRVHAWLADRGVRRSTVVTQAANGPACSLYRACGYETSLRETIYHFRPRGFVGGGRVGDSTEPGGIGGD